MDKPQHLSFSQLTSADACLAKWHAEKTTETVTVPSKPRDVGSIVHSMIETFLRDRADGVSVEDAQHGAKTAAFTAADSTAFIEESIAMFDRWVNRGTIAPEELLDVEGFYARTIEGAPQVIGYPDVVRLVNGEIRTRDDKTSWTSDVTPDIEFQGDMQAWLLDGEYPGKVVGSEVEFVRSGIIKERSYDKHRGAVTAQRIERTWERMERAIETGEFPETPGKHCGYCPRALSCAKGALAAAQGEVILSPEGAQEALVNLARFEAAASRLKDALKAHVGEYGPVESGGVSASFSVTESIGVTDPGALLKALGEKAKDVVSFDGRKKAVKALKSDPAFADLFAVTKRGNRFTIGGSLDEEYADLVDDEDEVA